MNIFILTVGSRGDIQPFVALGVGLRGAGHQVTICTSDSFRQFIAAHDLGYAYMTDELIRLTETEEGKAALEGEGKWGLIKKVKPIIHRMLCDAWTAVQAAQPALILYHPKALGGYHLAEKLNIPGVLSVPLPLYTPTAVFPNPIMPAFKLGGWYNRLTYKLIGLAQAPYMDVVNRWRVETLGLTPRPKLANDLVDPNGRPVPTLYPFSTHVVPRPHDWPETAVISGYWFLQDKSSWQPSAELVAFLEAGPPPVYIGFGSMAGRNPERLTKITLDALAQSVQRGLLATGWGGLKAANLPPNVFMLDAAPHDWLFPRMTAVVHHGGAGTTAAGLCAGKPTIICPFFGDQPFWGQRVFELGVGPKPMPQKRLTAESLAAAIQEVTTNQEMIRKSAELGGKIRAEDGVTQAVQFIEKWMSKQQPTG